MLPSGRGPTRGWCPGVLDPMETGDGWLLRVRVPGGFTTAATLRAVAAIAAGFGSGIVDITSRANLQIRGILADRLDPATAAVIDAGLVGDNAVRDAMRSVVSSPLTGHDPTAICDARPVVESIVDRLIERVSGPLPSKFGIVVDDGGGWSLRHTDADLSLLALDDGRWLVRVCGVPEVIGCTLDPVGVAEAATQWCVDAALRMDQLVAAVGQSAISARLALAVGESVAPVPQPVAGMHRMVGVFSHRNAATANVVAAPFLGRVDCAAMLGVADLVVASRADVRLTPDRSVALCGVDHAVVPQLLDDLSELGFVVDSSDPRAAISACVGSVGCLWAHADTLAAASLRAASARCVDRVHLSACAKQCGAPHGVRHLVADESGTFR